MNRSPTQILGILLVAACATEPAPTPELLPQIGAQEKKPPSPIKTTHPPRTSAAIGSQSSKPKPIPTRALNVVTNCTFSDETGYSGRLKLSIDTAKIQAFEAAVNIPKRGACRFDLKNFRQTRELPTVELSHLKDACVVRVWEQGERITVAFQDCRKHCSGSAWEHLWPILNDTRDGSCA